MSHTIFGIRHHGPGSARSLERALVELQPDTVLIEGPPEADDLIELAAREDMAPPVALLTYVPDEPGRAAFYPFARFSPEWRAMRHALDRDVPVRFMDLPAANKLAEHDDEPHRGLRADPLKALAEVAGHGDPERWWEDVIESRRDGLDAFEGVTEAMAALREAYPAHDPGEERREAYMRQSIRAAIKGGAERIAVVCGAWHAPALAEPGPAAPDQRTLRGMPKVKVAATWVPWTYGLLARASGYGAGVDSPAWYDQLFDESDEPVARWLARAAALLREKGLDASAAQVVDAARLAGALAGIRDRPLAGLDELLDATRAVLCLGSDIPLELVRAELVVGHRLGEVPEDTPMVPLQQDVARLQRRLRLKAEASAKELTLDLRREIDRERSRLLHRLNLLDVPWGSRVASRGQGTFKEAFRLEWYPELALELIHAGRWGTTVAAAADARVKARAGDEQSVGALAQLADAVLLADLPDALGGGVARARRPRGARPRHRRPDDRRPAARRHPALRRRARERHQRRRQGAARDRPARGDRPPGRGRRRRRGDRRAARDRGRRRQLGAGAAAGRRPHARLARGAAARRPRRAAPGHARRPRDPAPARRGRARPRQADVAGAEPR